MDSDSNSSYNSLDEIINNLQNNDNEEKLVAENNSNAINKYVINRTVSENSNCAKSLYETVNESLITLPDKANIVTLIVEESSDSNDKSNHKNVSDSIPESPVIANEIIEATEDPHNAIVNSEENKDNVSKCKGVQEEINLQKENRTTESTDIFLIEKSGTATDISNNPITTDGSNEFEKPSFDNRNISETCKLVESNLKSASINATNLPSENKDGYIITQFLDNSQVEAEARLAARRAARAEAREIRMREVERQQREQEENADRQFDMQEPMLLPTSGTAGRPSAASAVLRTTPSLRLTPGTAGSYLSSRRSSEDSLEDTGNVRDLRHELKDVEEKFRKAMIANAQLDNDKSSQTYQLELLKDRIEELEEAHAQLRREHRDKCRDHDQLQRHADRLQQDLNAVRAQLEDRDRLITEKGLVIVGGEDDLSEDGSYSETNLVAGSNTGGMVNGGSTLKRALVSVENAHMLEHAGEGSLDVRLARFAKDRSEFQDIISHLRLELEEERNRRRKNSNGILNGPTSDADFDDQHRVANKQLDDYKFRAQKAEQDVATLQANVARLESQVIRYKSSAEASEKSEEALKTEKRKLQREARDAQSRAEELETANTHLIKRLDKLKTAKSALLKEL